MEEAICLFFAPFVVGVAARAFKYDLVSQHMKVKRRSNKKPAMPKGPLTEIEAKKIFDLAGITSVDGGGYWKLSMICLPMWCHKVKTTKRLKIQLERGAEQYEEATDIL